VTARFTTTECVVSDVSAVQWRDGSVNWTLGFAGQSDVTLHSAIPGTHRSTRVPPPVADSHNPGTHR
jgi:hypothetical protein